MAPHLYYVLLLLSCGYALWRGQNEERIVAVTCLLATFASVVLIRSSSNRFADVETGVLLVDAAALTVFVLVALKSSRFWPLWVAGLDLTGGFAHLLRLFDGDLLPTAYSVAVQFWAYPVLIVLAFATWRGRHRLLGDDAGLPAPV